MHRHVSVIALVAAGLFWTTASQAQTADDIVEKHLAAMGGRAVLSKATTQVAKGTVAIATQGFDLPGTVDVYRRAPNKVRSLLRIDMSAVGGTEMVVDQRCDGKTAFVSNSMRGDREITGEQLQAMLNASFPSPLLTYKASGAKVELVGKEKIGDRAVFVLQYTPTAGPSSRNYFDAETYLLLRNVAAMDVPEAGGRTEQTSDFSDFRDTGGIKMPFRVTQITATQTMTIILTSIEINSPVDETMFARPVK